MKEFLSSLKTGFLQYLIRKIVSAIANNSMIQEQIVKLEVKAEATETEVDDICVEALQFITDRLKGLG
jgi:hypothetical protein